MSPTIRRMRRGDQVVTSVYDSGIGIPADEPAQVFERHGGAIWVESKEGSGTTFYFSLPINQEGEVGRSETGKTARS